MGTFRIEDHHTAADVEGKHVVVNCSTAETFACDTPEEAAELSAEHDKAAAEGAVDVNVSLTHDGGE